MASLPELRGTVAVTWTTREGHHRQSDATCAYCGSRAPEDPDDTRHAGWQVRNDYPIKFRCPLCRHRQEHETAA